MLVDAVLPRLVLVDCVALEVVAVVVCEAVVVVTAAVKFALEISHVRTGALVSLAAALNQPAVTLIVPSLGPSLYSSPTVADWLGIMSGIFAA